jgi:hypothetical protein
LFGFGSGDLFGFGSIVSGGLPQPFNGEMVGRLPRQTFGACGLLPQIVDPAHDPALELNGQFETNALVPNVVSLALRPGELCAGCHTG